MNPQQVLVSAQEAMTVRRVFGDPIQADGATILPVAKINGGGGGGGHAEEGGGGFGVNSRPAGVFVVRDGHASWRPAVDINKIILGGQLVAIAAPVILGPIVRRWLIPAA